MKFATVLRESAVELPDTADLFQKYKQLKKSLKRIPAAPGTDAHLHPHPCAEGSAAPPPDRAGDGGAAVPAGGAAAVPAEHSAAEALDAAEEAAFLRAITADVVELNDRYIEKEEIIVIKFAELESAAVAVTAAGAPSEAATQAYRAFVDFHGELLMLLHWSILAYTGVVKILKKHRKRTGAPLHAPHLENLLAQPFCSVEVTSDMVRRAEAYVVALAQVLAVPPPPLARLPGLLPTVGSETMTSPEGIDAAQQQQGGQGQGVHLGGQAKQQEQQQQQQEGRSREASTLVAVPGGSGSAAAPGTDQHNTPPAAGAADAAQSAVPLSSSHLQYPPQQQQQQQQPPPNPHKRLASHLYQQQQDQEEGGEQQQQGARDTDTTRRVRAALHVWQRLQSNVHTPSTMIAGRGEGGLHPPAQLATSEMTNSSVA